MENMCFCFLYTVYAKQTTLLNLVETWSQKFWDTLSNVGDDQATVTNFMWKSATWIIWYKKYFLFGQLVTASNSNSVKKLELRDLDIYVLKILLDHFIYSFSGRKLFQLDTQICKLNITKNIVSEFHLHKMFEGFMWRLCNCSLAGVLNRP